MRFPQRYLFGIALLLVAALAFSACGSPGGLDQSTKKAAMAVQMPDYVMNASAEVQTAYQYALTNPEALETVPCYCGCSRMGHQSNLACYVQPTSTDEAVVFDNHAAFCGVCIDITLDVKRMTEEGKSPKEIRAYVDVTYSSFGPPTDTKMPTD